MLFQASVLVRYLDRLGRELGVDLQGDVAGALAKLREFDLEQLENLQFNLKETRYKQFLVLT